MRSCLTAAVLFSSSASKQHTQMIPAAVKLIENRQRLPPTCTNCSALMGTQEHISVEITSCFCAKVEKNIHQNEFTNLSPRRQGKEVMISWWVER